VRFLIRSAITAKMSFMVEKRGNHLELAHAARSRPAAQPVRLQGQFHQNERLGRRPSGDTANGEQSVTYDLEAVLKKIEHWHQGSIAGFRIMYGDSDGYWGSILGWPARYVFRTPGNERGCSREEDPAVTRRAK
jgi:hypothetical protein